VLTKNVVLFFSTLGLCYPVFSDEFHIEDAGLKLVPAEVSASIKAGSNSVFDGCEIIGKKVDLDEDGQFDDILATTKDACAWGRMIGPIWGIRKQESRYTLVLSASGGALKTLDSSSSGLKDLRADSGSAGYATVNLYKFNGVKYIEKSYFFSADDVDECLKHKNICPFEVD
jgi:hypothetical protein